MSCLENDIAYEACFERFQEVVEGNYDLEGFIAYCFLEPWYYYRVCKDGYWIWDYTTKEHVFDVLWKWDSEGMYYDIAATIEKYYEARFK